MIKVYTTDCPRCKVLEKKLVQAGIHFEYERDVDKMRELGIASAPMMDVGDGLMDFTEALKWINSYDDHRAACETCKL